jgi:hypothetical protein
MNVGAWGLWEEVDGGECKYEYVFARLRFVSRICGCTAYWTYLDGKLGRYIDSS